MSALLFALLTILPTPFKADETEVDAIVVHDGKAFIIDGGEVIYIYDRPGFLTRKDQMTWVRHCRAYRYHIVTVKNYYGTIGTYRADAFHDTSERADE